MVNLILTPYLNKKNTNYELENLKNDIKKFQLIPEVIREGTNVTRDFKNNRVRIIIDKDNIIKSHSIG